VVDARSFVARATAMIVIRACVPAWPTLNDLHRLGGEGPYNSRDYSRALSLQSEGALLRHIGAISELTGIRY